MTAETRKWVLVSTAVVLFVAAGALLYTRGNVRAQYPREKIIECVDLKSGQDVLLRTSFLEPAPYVNKATGQRTLYPWYFCTDCQHRFVPDLVPGDPPKVPMVPVCPLCQSGHGTPWLPEDPEQAQPKKPDAPLPKLQ